MRPLLTLDTTHLRPGLRLAVGLSGGADSVALLLALHRQARELGLVLHAAHLHHGLRGAEADADLAFCRDLAVELKIPFHESRVETAVEARPDPARSKPAESLEEAARRLRYSWFRQLLSNTPPRAGSLDAIATAHTRDDQAETVLAKFLRGAWTEGLSGIYPKLESLEGGRILRPLLAVTRVQVEEFLRDLNQPWRTDSSNADPVFTRNRIRHDLLPALESFNPRLREHLAQMATLARDEEAFWQSEVELIAAQLFLPGRPARGGGRAASPGLDALLALDITRLAALAPALQRRLLRHAAARFNLSLGFPSTESLRALALMGRAGQKLPLAGGLLAERTHRELRLSLAADRPENDHKAQVTSYAVPIPGEVLAPAFQLALRIDLDFSQAPMGPALLRPWKPGDRVRLRHSSGPRKVKEVLERLRVTGNDRALWPVLELDGRVLWMRGVELEPEAGLHITTRANGPAA